MNDRKFLNAARSWDTMAKVSQGIFRAAGFVCLIFAVLVVIFGSRMFETGSFSLDLDFLKLYLADEFQTPNALIQAFAVIGLVAVGIICFIVSYGVRQFRDILAPMKDGRPFEAHTPRKLRNIAWTVLAAGLVSQVTAVAEQLILTKAYPMEQIFSSPVIARIEYSYTMDFGFVFAACIILLLSYVFSYGCKLQRESDETL